MKLLAGALKHVLWEDGQRRHDLLHRRAPVQRRLVNTRLTQSGEGGGTDSLVWIRRRNGGIIYIPPVGGRVEIDVVVRERRELGGLRRDLAAPAFVPLRLDEVDLGCAAALVIRGAGVVFPWAGARAEGRRIRERASE